MAKVFDLAIIGGGVNGCGIARDAAGRGLSVLLLEQGDLAGATSSASTKLIHGGLRYLEHHAFRLVRESLAEREVLLRMAPHIIWPLRFVLPHHPGLRPWWLIRTGLFLYDHLGGRRTLPATRSVDLRADPAGDALREEFVRGFEYSDCWVDDARLVVLNARDAAARGAEIRTRVRCETAHAADGVWQVGLSDGGTERARVLVNASGPFVSRVLGRVLGGAVGGVPRQAAPLAVRLVKGSHIVVPRIADHDRCYIFQNADKRIVFAIPYEHDFTLIGTTDEDYTGDPGAVAVTEVEERYLCAAVSAYLKRPVDQNTIVWRYAGVRPLRDDGATAAQEATRDYVLDLHGTPPVLNVFGGKITTYRRLAEAALARLAVYFPSLPGPWTSGSTLPGGDFPPDGAPALQARLREAYPFLAPATAQRLVRAYGTDAWQVLGDARRFEDLGAWFGADLTQREVNYLVRWEWARSAADILWRRGKFGLRLGATAQERLADYLS